MRWRRVAVAVGIAGVLVTTGCGLPDGVDGDFVDGWTAMAAPQGFVPEAGTCHTDASSGTLNMYRPVPCTESHVSETAYVGTFTEADATRGSVPTTGSAPMRRAHSGCDTGVREFLGDDWRAGRIYLTIVLPSPSAWRGGARWFRCDVSETASLDDDTVKAVTRSLKGALAANAPLRHTCFTTVGTAKDFKGLRAIACGRPHHAEYAGLWTATQTSYDRYVKDRERIHRACRGVIAKYANVPDDGDMAYRTGTVFYGPTSAEWGRGNRGVRCFVWLSTARLKRSVKGAGTSVLPIN